MRVVQELSRIGGALTFAVLLARCSGTSGTGDAGDLPNGGSDAGEVGAGRAGAEGGSAGSSVAGGGFAGSLAGGGGKAGSGAQVGGNSGVAGDSAGSAGVAGAGGAAASAGSAGEGGESGGEAGKGAGGIGEGGKANGGESGEANGGESGEANGGAGGVSEPPRLAGDLCSSALTLETNTSGSTLGFTNDHQNVSCVGWSIAGPDVAYAISVPPASRLEITADPGDGFDIVLYVVLPPADNCVSVPVCTRAADDVTKGGTETLTLDNHGTEPQSYFLLVDGYGAETNAGTYDLTVSELPIPPGEVCETALPLAIGEPVPATLDGWAHDYTAHPACTAVPANGGDTVYAVTVPAGNTLTLSATPLDVMDLALYAFDVATAAECGTATTCLALADAGFGGDAETLVYTNTGEERSIFVHVDRFDRGSALGHYTLVGTLAPALTPAR